MGSHMKGQVTWKKAPGSERANSLQRKVKRGRLLKGLDRGWESLKVPERIHMVSAPFGSFNQQINIGRIVGEKK